MNLSNCDHRCGVGGGVDPNSVTKTLIRWEISHITDTEELDLVLDRVIPHIAVSHYIFTVNMTLVIELNSLKLKRKVEVVLLVMGDGAE